MLTAVNGTAVLLSTGAPSGHVVAVISADDPDDGDNACLSYTIVSGNDDDLFEVATPKDGRIAVKRSLLGATETRRLFALRVDVTDGGTPPLATSAILNIVVDASLPFAPAHKRFVVVSGSNRTIALVLSSLSSAMLILLVTVVLLLRRFSADRKRDRQTGSGSCGGRSRLGWSSSSSSSRLVRTALARYRDGRRRRRAKQSRSLAVASRDSVSAQRRDFAGGCPRDEELRSLSRPPSELNECEMARGISATDCSADDTVLAREDDTSAIIIVNNNTDPQSSYSTFLRI